MEQNIRWRYEKEDGTPAEVVITPEHIRPASYLVRNQLGPILEENAVNVRKATEEHEIALANIQDGTDEHRAQMNKTIEFINDLNTECFWKVIALILTKDRELVLSDSFKVNCDQGILSEIVASFRSRIRK